MARRCSRLFVSAARASVLCLPVGKCSPLSVSASCYLSLSSWAAPGSGTSPWDAAGGFWLLLLPFCPGLKHKEVKSGPGQMGCGFGVRAQINMPQTILTSRVMGRGASGASHVSSNM